MSDTAEPMFTSTSEQWRSTALSIVGEPAAPGKCPDCHASSVSAAWHLVDLVARTAEIDLKCSSCKATASLQITLPPDASGVYPLERLAKLGPVVQAQILSIQNRIRQHAKTMPAAAFSTHPLWAKAKWNATAFRWHPTSEAPPVMGLVFENAEAGLEIFREAERQMNHADRFEEIRVSIIEGPVPGQENRQGYSVHIAPDPEALNAHATTEDFVVDPMIVPLMGQWNRHYPISGMPAMLPKFKREFEKHKEFLLAPVIRKADGQQWFEPKLGIIKNTINFRYLSEVRPDDPDAAALVLPQLITPPA